MKRKYILLLSILTFQGMKKSDYWRHSADTEVLLAILLMISRVLVRPFANILSLVQNRPLDLSKGHGTNTSRLYRPNRTGSWLWALEPVRGVGHQPSGGFQRTFRTGLYYQPVLKMWWQVASRHAAALEPVCI